MDTTDVIELEPAAEWRAADVADPSTWTVELTRAHQDELEDAVAAARAARDDDLLAAEPEDFALPGLADVLAEVERTLIDGRGFVRLRGLPLDRWDTETAVWAYWAIGRHLGEPWPQNARGHVLGDVTDEGKDPNDPTVRGYQMGGVALPFHCDGSDLVGLLCVRNGKEGGESRIANSVWAHNELVRTRPDLAAELYRPFPYDMKGEEKEGGKPFYEMPVFTRVGDRLFIRLIRPFIESSQRHPEAPRLTELQIEALDAFEAHIRDPANRVEMGFEPGDIQFINNYHVLHGRAAYVDWDDSADKRLLKRLWLYTRSYGPDERPSWARMRNHWAERGVTRAS